MSRMSLNQAIAAGDLAYVQERIGEGVRLDTRNDKGTTPLMFAAHYAQPEIVEALLDAGAEVNARNAAGLSALHLAAGCGSVPTVKLLLAHGADMQARSTQGDTPLMRALARRHTDVVHMLRQAQAHGQQPQL